MKATLTATGIADIQAELTGFSEMRIRSVLATALSKTARDVQAAEVHEMEDSFDRPKKYTLNAIYVKPATAQTLVSEVGIKDDASGGRAPLAWLQWQVRGGMRRQTGFEKALVRGGAMHSDMRAVPGRFARLDAFGNVSPGQMTQILSQLRIETGRAGSTRAMAKILPTDGPKEQAYKRKSIRAAQKRAGGQFVAFPNGRGKLLPGVYLLRDTAWGRAAPKPIFIFVTKAQYEQRFDFYFVAELGAARLGQYLGEAIDASRARLAARAPA